VNRLTLRVYYTGTVAAGSSGQCASVPQANRSTPGVTLSYDNGAQNALGRLVSVATADGTTQAIVGYDALGRITSSSETISGGLPYAFGYTYTLADGLKTASYSSGRVVTNTYDSAGRITQISGRGKRRSDAGELHG
jgi:YD repeat-containing protein